MSLYAPACTVEFANRTYVPAAMNKVIDPKRVFVEILSDANERNDTVGPYGKSLLYLVSRALEPTHKTPLLGMEAVWKPVFDKKDVFAKDPHGKLNLDIAGLRKAWLPLMGAPNALTEAARRRRETQIAARVHDQIRTRMFRQLDRLH